MIAAFFDAKDSTPDLERRGHQATVALREQLDAVAARLLRDLPNESAPNLAQRFIGQRQRDGMLIGAPRVHAIPLLWEALKIQDEGAWQHKGWLPLRMSLGVGEVVWDRGAYKEGSVPNGRDLVIISRLMGQCPPYSTVVNEPLLRLMREHDRELYALFEERHAELKGIEGVVTYGLMPSRTQPPVLAVFSAWRRFVRSPFVYVLYTLGTLAWLFLLGWWRGWWP